MRFVQYYKSQMVVVTEVNTFCPTVGVLACLRDSNFGSYLCLTFNVLDILIILHLPNFF